MACLGLHEIVFEGIDVLNTITTGLVLMLASKVLISAQIRAETCESFSEQQKKSTTTFVEKQFGFPQSSSLVVKDARPVPGSCYLRSKLLEIGT